jgi:hypothetical protein
MLLHIGNAGTQWYMATKLCIMSLETAVLVDTCYENVTSHAFKTFSCTTPFGARIKFQTRCTLLIAYVFILLKENTTGQYLYNVTLWHHILDPCCP